MWPALTIAIAALCALPSSLATQAIPSRTFSRTATITSDGHMKFHADASDELSAQGQTVLETEDMQNVKAHVSVLGVMSEGVKQSVAEAGTPPKTCHTVAPYKGKDAWCNKNCNWIPPNCPASMCSCTTHTQAVTAAPTTPAPMPLTLTPRGRRRRASTPPPAETCPASVCKVCESCHKEKDYGEVFRTVCTMPETLPCDDVPWCAKYTEHMINECYQDHLDNKSITEKIADVERVCVIQGLCNSPRTQHCSTWRQEERCDRFHVGSKSSLASVDHTNSEMMSHRSSETSNVTIQSDLDATVIGKCSQ